MRFASAEQAQRAVESMNEARHVLVDSPSGGGGGPGSSVIGGKPICCKLADKADPKRRAVNAAAALAAAVAAGANHSSHANGEAGGANPSPRKPQEQLSMSTNHQHQPIPAHLQQQAHQLSGLIFPSGIFCI